MAGSAKHSNWQESGEVDCPKCGAGYIEFVRTHYHGDSGTGQPPEDADEMGPCSHCDFEDWEEGYVLVKHSNGFWEIVWE